MTALRTVDKHIQTQTGMLSVSLGSLGVHFLTSIATKDIETTVLFLMHETIRNNKKKMCAIVNPGLRLCMKHKLILNIKKHT